MLVRGLVYRGVPLACYFPEKQITLLDSNTKKISFLRQVCSELKFSNIHVEQARLEQYQPPQLFDTIITRAVGKITEIYLHAANLLTPQGQALFMKGQFPREELESFNEPVQVKRLHVPGLNAERHIVLVSSS